MNFEFVFSVYFTCQTLITGSTLQKLFTVLKCLKVCALFIRVNKTQQTNESFTLSYSNQWTIANKKDLIALTRTQWKDRQSCTELCHCSSLQSIFWIWGRQELGLELWPMWTSGKKSNTPNLVNSVWPPHPSFSSSLFFLCFFHRLSTLLASAEVSAADRIRLSSFPSCRGKNRQMGGEGELSSSCCWLKTADWSGEQSRQEIGWQSDMQCVNNQLRLSSDFQWFNCGFFGSDLFIYLWWVMQARVTCFFFVVFFNLWVQLLFKLQPSQQRSPLTYRIVVR